MVRYYFLILLILPIAVGEVMAAYRCKGPDGSVVYQDTPCDANSVQKSVPGTNASRSLSSQSTNLKLTPGERELLRQRELREAEERRQLMEGMDEMAVRRVLGKPDKINRDVSSQRGTWDQWVYYEKDKRGKINYSGGTTYVYMRNGKLSSWTESSSKRP